MAKVTSLQLIDPLKVFVEYDAQYQTYVAQCIQTGHLVTADDPETVKEMIAELLEEEVSLAIKNNDVSTLLSNPAPLTLRIKWELAYATAPEKVDRRTIKIVHGEVPHELRLLLGQAEVEAKVEIAEGRTSRAA